MLRVEHEDYGVFYTYKHCPSSKGIGFTLDLVLRGRGAAMKVREHSAEQQWLLKRGC